ncbi:SIR2 family protein [Cohnella herbarum]|uniref:SIR2-like domain-containing protein n=1 Tax=Cohnella herbarum TaxID=2728023 RepID=A0A7Z2ZPU9_9BACL|nr:SIR2 family protein [Cohnella herbarum]QJD86347.1 hypothetical protein HH215_26395 [Cohnella herbarum]
MGINLPTAMVDMLKDGNCGLFIGAGISMSSPSNLPGWGKLLSNMIQHGIDLGRVDYKESIELTECVEKELLLEVAEYLADKLQGQYREYLVSIFDGSNLRSNDNHKYIAQINTPLIVTTNYDKLLEGSMDNPLICFLSPTMLQQIHKPGNRKKVLKIHGTISEPESLILSEKDYVRLMSREDLALVTKSYFHRYSFVFLGCSLTDPDILMFLKNLNNVFLGSTSPHYALVKQGSFNNIQSQYYKNTYNICLIPFDEYSELTTFLKSVVDLQKNSFNTDVVVKREILKSINDLIILEYYIHQIEFIHNRNFDRFSEVGEGKLTKGRISDILQDYEEAKKFYAYLSDQLTQTKYYDFPLDIYTTYYGKIDRCIELLKDKEIQRNQSKRRELSELDEYIMDNSDNFIKLMIAYVRMERVRINMGVNTGIEEEVILESYMEEFNFSYKEFN